MSKMNSNQFSVKVKAPWWVLRDPEKLKNTYEEKLRGFTSRAFRVSVRIFSNVMKCRFTVIFQNKWEDTAAAEQLIEKVARRTLLAIMTEETNNR